LIATQQPVGTDLRRIATMLKVSSDLERMGDHAVSIAKATIRLKNETYIKPLIDIPKMSELIKEMVHEVLAAYVELDRDAIISPLHLSITFVVEQFNHVCFSKFIPDLFTRLSVPCFVSVISLDYYGGKMKLRISLIHPPMCKVLTHLLFPLSETASNIILCLLFLWISKNDIRFIEFYDFTI